MKSGLELLELVISNIWRRLDLARVKAVSEWPASQKFNKLQHSIVFSKFYQQFIDKFLTTTQPFHDLPKFDTSFVWMKKFNKELKGLNKVLVLAPIFKNAYLYKTFVLKC